MAHHRHATLSAPPPRPHEAQPVMQARSLWDTVTAPARALTQRKPKPAPAPATTPAPATDVAPAPSGATRARKPKAARAAQADAPTTRALKPDEWAKPGWNPDTRLVVSSYPGKVWAWRHTWHCGKETAGAMLVAYAERDNKMAAMHGFHLEDVRVVVES